MRSSLKTAKISINTCRLLIEGEKSHITNRFVSHLKYFSGNKLSCNEDKTRTQFPMSIFDHIHRLIVLECSAHFRCTFSYLLNGERGPSLTPATWIISTVQHSGEAGDAFIPIFNCSLFSRTKISRV